MVVKVIPRKRREKRHRDWHRCPSCRFRCSVPTLTPGGNCPSCKDDGKPVALVYDQQRQT